MYTAGKYQSTVNLKSLEMHGATRVVWAHLPPPEAVKKARDCTTFANKQRIQTDDLRPVPVDTTTQTAEPAAFTVEEGA